MTTPLAGAANRFKYKCLVATLEKHGARVLSIGPETTKALKKLCVEPAVEAQPHSIDGMVEALTAAAG